MTITLRINYSTRWGEQIILSTGGKTYPMQYNPGGLWIITLPLAAFGHSYRYILVSSSNYDTILRCEWRSHSLPPSSSLASGRGSQKRPSPPIIIDDSWQDRPVGSTFYSSAFTDVIFARRSRSHATLRTGRVTLWVPAAEVRPGEVLAVTGSGPLFADWSRFLPLDDSRFPWWSVTLDAKSPFAYKYVILDSGTGAPLRWESGPDRHSGDIPAPGSHRVIAADRPVFASAPWRGAGTAIPVFSLRSEDSFGVGEFHDLKKLVDWAVATGQNVIQILPVNDTTMTRTWQDSYPYNANSSFALHPQFIHLPAAGVRADKAYRALRDELNALPQEDYERVNNEKMRLLRKACSTSKVTSTPAYKAFVDANAYWLLPYAAYSALRDEKGTADFTKWGKYSKYNQKSVSSYIKAHPDETGFYCFLQYCLDEQLKDAVKYAHSHGIILKGDLPIGVSRTSADAWTHPELFHMDSQAGAPPDAFAADGQNWGFPTYNWEKMAEDGFAWWKNRLRKMSEYFDAFRIDHILGFFRIWEIPSQYKSGLMGHFNPALPYSGDELRSRGLDPACGLFLEDPRKPGYFHPRISSQFTDAYKALPDYLKDSYNALYDDFFYHRHNQFWKDSAYLKLPSLIRTTGMLACGEDLGMIPATVPETMEDLNILSLEIQRMPKDQTVKFCNPESYPYFSVCATGTHDTSPLRAWWEEDRDATNEYYHGILHHDGDAPFYCEPWICEEIVRSHMQSPSMLAILPLQDWLSIDGDIRYQGNPADERINVPAIPRHYWRYRMHLTLETLLASQSLNTRLREIIAARG